MRKQMLAGDLGSEEPLLSRGHLLHTIVDSAQRIIGLTLSKHRRGRSLALARSEPRHLLEKFKLRFNLGAQPLSITLWKPAVAGGLPYLIKFLMDGRDERCRPAVGSIAAGQVAAFGRFGAIEI